MPYSLITARSAHAKLLSWLKSNTMRDLQRFNERLLVDLCQVVEVRGNRYWSFVAVDQHTDYSVIAPCPSHESQAVAKIFQTVGTLTYWCATEGGP